MNVTKIYIYWMLVGLFLLGVPGLKAKGVADTRGNQTQHNRVKDSLVMPDDSLEPTRFSSGEGIQLPNAYKVIVYSLGVIAWGWAAFCFILFLDENKMASEVGGLIIDVLVGAVCYDFFFMGKVIELSPRGWKYILRRILYVIVSVLQILMCLVGLVGVFFSAEESKAPISLAVMLSVIFAAIMALGLDLLVDGHLAKRFFAFVATPASASSQEAATKKEAVPPASTKSPRAAA